MNLKNKTLNGAKWSAIATLSSISISFIQIILLSHILPPHEFGLLSLALLVTMIADTISDFGITNSIIQKQNLTNEALSSLYWFNVLLGFVVFITVFSLSDVISSWFHQADLSPLIKTLSFAFLIIPHGQQYRAIFQKELEFNKVGIVETSSLFVGFIVTLTASCFYPMAITAIWGYLCMTSFRMVFFCYLGRRIYYPKSSFDIHKIKGNLKFGAYLTADAIVNQLNSNVATFILSRTLGVIAAGGYNLAANVAVFPPSKLNPILTRVMFPAFSKIQNDIPKLRSNFYKLLSFVGFVNFPALLGLLVVSHNFVSVVFGEKWQFITPALQVLCLVGLLRAIGNPIGSLLMAKSKVDVSFKFNIFKLVLFIPSIWIGTRLGDLLGAAVGFLFVQVINSFLSYFVLIKPILGSSYREYIRSITDPFVLTIPMVIISWLIGCIDIFNSDVYKLIAQIMAGVLTYFVCIAISKNVLICEIKTLLFNKLS